MKNHSQGKEARRNTGEPAAVPATASSGEVAPITRRALLKSGWMLPVILAITLPDTASAASPESGGGKSKRKAKGHGD